MEVGELQINDWVCTKSDSTPRLVDWIRTSEVGLFWNKTDTPSCLVPIPLTPEILEKNRFESNSNIFGLYDYELSESYILENRGNRFCFVKRIPGHRSTFYITDIKYVHELQHALRLCGIEHRVIL